MKFGKQKEMIAIFLLVIFIVSFLIRLWPVTVVHYWDEDVYLQNAEVLFGLKENTYNELNFRPPLISILFGMEDFVWNNAISGSILVALFGAICVIGFFFLGKELYNTKTGIIASVLACFIPQMVWNSWTLLADAPALTLLVLSAYAFVRYYRRREESFAFIAGILIGLTILMRFSVIPYLAILGIIFILMSKTMLKEKTLSPKPLILKKFWIGILIIFGPYLAAMQIYYGSFVLPFITGAFAVMDINQPAQYYTLQLSNVFSPIVIIGLALFLIILTANLIFGKKIKRKKEIVQKIITNGDLFLLIGFVLLLIFMSTTPHKEERYLLLPLGIPLILLSARGILIISKKAASYSKSGTKYIIAFAFIALAIFSFYPLTEKLNSPFINYGITEEYSISKAIATGNFPADSIIYTNFNYPVFAYYTDYKTEPIWTWQNNFYENYPKNMPKHGFLIIYKDNNNAPTTSWASKQQELKKYIDSNNIEVYWYEPPGP